MLTHLLKSPFRGFFIDLRLWCPTKYIIVRGKYMFAGILGTWNLLANISQGVAVNDRSLACAVIINVCNRGGANAAVSIAISTSPTSPSGAEWIEWNTIVSPKSTLERQSILVPSGKYVVVRSNRADVNAVVYGVQNGDPITVAGITQNPGTAPSWVTSATQTVRSGEAISLQLETSNEENETVSYSLTSGTLPSGLSLSPGGLISGTVATAGYPSADVVSSVTITATDSQVLSTPQVFNITRKWNDGSSSLVAAPNAQSIKTMTGTTTNQAYWINTGSGAVSTYCLMSVGGGYMLAGKIPSTTAIGSDWAYDGQNWFKTSTVNESAIANATAGSAVGRSYYEYRLATGFAMALGSVTNVLTFTKTGVTPREALAGATSTNLEGQLTRANFMTWIATAGTAASNWDNQPNSNRIRLNTLNDITNVGMRFGITMNNEADDLTNDSAIGFGTFSNGQRGSGTRNIDAGGHRWTPAPEQFPYQGYIFVA